MKKFLILALTLLTVFPLLLSCSASKTKRCDFFAMDTVCSLQLSSTAQTEQLFSDAQALVEKVEAEYSKTRAGSIPSVFSSGGGSAQLSEEQASFFSQILSVCQNTDGSFDPTLGAVSALWGFGGDAERVPGDAERADALLHTGYQKLHLSGTSLTCDDKALQLDLGGAAKGYAAQKLYDMLNGRVEYGVINLGGNIALIGEKKDGSAFEIGVRSALESGAVCGTLSLYAPAFVSVSGNYERYFEKDGKRYHHILSPTDGMPVENGIASVCVISKDGALSDMLSTALFVMGAEKAAAFWEDNGSLFDAVIQLQNGELFCSDSIAEAFRPADAASVKTFSSMLNDLEIRR